MNKELLLRYCNNSCTEEDINYVLEWFKDYAATSEGKSLLFKIWEELPEDEGIPQTDFNLLLGRIHHEINLNQSKKLLQLSDHNLIKYRKREKFINILFRAAAILIFPILSFGLYMSVKYHSVKNDTTSVCQSYNEVFSSVDAITKVTLPDGSIAWLNHSSSLKYPAIFQGDTRRIELTGEGYFEVAHNPKVPFIVNVGEFQIKARGTIFNVMAYPDEDKIETSLINGQVELQLNEKDGQLIPLLKMNPTDLVIFHKSNNEINTRKISDDRYFSWKEGKLIFNKEPMDEVVKKLSRWFNVDIQLKDSKLGDLTYTATFINETLPQVMELLSLVTPINYSISNRKEISGGTFTKRKVILSYKENRIKIKSKQ
jgi:transmembrane sensor